MVITSAKKLRGKSLAYSLDMYNLGSILLWLGELQCFLPVLAGMKVPKPPM